MLTLLEMIGKMKSVIKDKVLDYNILYQRIIIQ